MLITQLDAHFSGLKKCAKLPRWHFLALENGNFIKKIEFNKGNFVGPDFAQSDGVTNTISFAQHEHRVVLLVGIEDLRIDYFQFLFELFHFILEDFVRLLGDVDAPGLEYKHCVPALA